MLDLAEAQARLLAMAPVLEVERRDIADGYGFYLTQHLIARTSRPEAPTSAMDGYAVAHGGGGGPWQVVGESAAGHPHGASLGPGEAVRIATGALLPPETDTVLIQEDCRREAERVTLATAMPRPGANVRAAGNDFHAGERLLARGTRLGPAALALAMTAGHTTLPLRRALNIAVIDGGDELVAPGAPLGLGQVAASNAPMLAALLASEPCSVRRAGPIRDRLDDLTAALATFADADILVTTGGASVGDHDLVRPALTTVGAELAFWRVAIKPGKPLLVARRGRQVILGLPGNPVSALVTGFLFLLPLVRAALGAAEPLPRAIATRLTTAMPATRARAEFVRGRWDGAAVEPLATQDSGALWPLAQANALIIRHPESPPLASGASVTVYLLHNGGIA